MQGSIIEVRNNTGRRIPSGSPVQLNDHNAVGVYANGGWLRVPVGVAARNIEKGEVIQYCPEKNTDDILIRTGPMKLRLAQESEVTK